MPESDEANEIEDEVKPGKAKRKAANDDPDGPVKVAVDKAKQEMQKNDHAEKDYALNLERDKNREINTDWFYREVVVGCLSEAKWSMLDKAQHESLNRALVRFDPTHDEDAPRLSNVAESLGLDSAGREELIEVWRKRPKLEKRLKLSRRAVRNLIPYMEKTMPNGQWPTQIEARIAFSEDQNAHDQPSEKPASDYQRARYVMGGSQTNKRDR